MHLVLFAALLLPSALTSMECVAFGASVPNSIQTQPAQGPGGASALLKVSSHDDASKDSHQCSADYQLVITRGTAEPAVVDLLTSDDEYGRKLSMQLAGFSQDGNRVLGILSESGKYQTTLLFDYDETKESKVQLIDLRERFAHVAGARCLTTFEVMGTAISEAVVIQAGSTGRCAAQGRWLLEPAGGRPTRLGHETTVSSLYRPSDVR